MRDDPEGGLRCLLSHYSGHRTARQPGATGKSSGGTFRGARILRTQQLLGRVFRRAACRTQQRWGRSSLAPSGWSQKRAALVLSLQACFQLLQAPPRRRLYLFAADIPVFFADQAFQDRHSLPIPPPRQTRQNIEGQLYVFLGEAQKKKQAVPLFGSQFNRLLRSHL